MIEFVIILCDLWELILMKKKLFPGIKHLPRGMASDIIKEGCIVLEGGAFRGTYTEGVLDALMENDINMQCTIGVSAGAMNGMNYVSGQIGRSARMTFKYRKDSRYIGIRAFAKDHGIVGFDFLFNKSMELEWFSRKRFNNPNRRFVAVATNCITGETEYFDRDTCENIDEAVKASAALPLVSQPVELSGMPHFDGGCSCKIPYQWAIDNGYDKIIVVKTRHDDYRKTVGASKIDKVVGFKFKKFPKLIESLAKSDENYNQQCDELDKLAKEKRVFIISPSKNVTVGRFEGDLNKLEELYYLGYNDALNKISDLKAYLDDKG